MDLNETLRAIHTMLRRLVRENVAITLDLDSRIPSVRVDSSQIDQVCVNLVLNAAYALPEGGTISIVTTNLRIAEPDPARPYVPAGTYVSLVVKDDGSGMTRTRSRAFRRSSPPSPWEPVSVGDGTESSSRAANAWIDSEIGSTSVTICFEAAGEAG